MIQCDYFIDPGAGLNGADCYNARVRDDHSISVTFYSELEMREALATVWNSKHSDNQKSPEDFQLNTVDPY